MSLILIISFLHIRTNLFLYNAIASNIRATSSARRTSASGTLSNKNAFSFIPSIVGKIYVTRRISETQHM